MFTRALLLIGLAAAAATAAGSEALLPNGSFEEVDETTGYPLHWQPVWNKPTTCAYTLARARTGVACAMVTDAATDQSHGLRSAHVPVTPGQWYEATAWVRIEPGGKQGFALYLEFWNNKKVRGEHRSAHTTKSGRWVRLRLMLKAPPDAHTATVLIYGSSATVGKAYFDDATLAQMKRKGE